MFRRHVPIVFVLKSHHKAKEEKEQGEWLPGDVWLDQSCPVQSRQQATVANHGENLTEQAEYNKTSEAASLSNE